METEVNQNNSVLYQLGVMSGKMDGLLNQLMGQDARATAALSSHMIEDGKNLTDLRTELGNLKGEVSAIREKQMFWAGGIAVASAAFSIGGQFLLSHLLK